MIFIKGVLLLFSVGWAQPTVSDADLFQALIGKWKYDHYIFRGQNYQRSSQRLNLQFHFFPDGANQLTWFWEGVAGICDRKGRFSVEAGMLVDETVWVNPDNDIGCAMDPDMQLGRKTKTPLSVEGKYLYLHLVMGGEPLVYVWENI